MSKKGITGHDEWVITQALATALVALEHFPPKIQPKPHMEDLGDVMLVQKIALETDERGALAVANRFFVPTGPRNALLQY